MTAVTLVVTSCGRFDLLRRTLASFFLYNTYPLSEVIITEDSGQSLPSWIWGYHPYLTLLNPRNNVGQVASIDRAYSLVRTPYVFHCEDDWEFYREGFIEESLQALESDPKCIALWLRETWDTNTHPIEGDRLVSGYQGWYGFTWNPSLKRMSDYWKLFSYAACARHYTEMSSAWMAEKAVGEEYHRHGYYARIAHQGYVRHIGEGRRVT